MKIKIYISGLILLTINFVACRNHALSRTFLIPSDYEGILRVVYAENCGVNPKEENGREVFEFSKKGIVILTSDIDDRIKNDFFLVDSIGTRTKVNQIAGLKGQINQVPVILVGDVVVTSSFVNNNTLQSGGAVCEDFYLYNKNTTKIGDAKDSKELDSLTNSLVNACRTNR